MTPDAAGAVQGRQAQQLGAGVTALAGGLQTGAIVAQDHIDAANLFNAESAVQVAYLDWAAKAKQSRAGVQAVGVSQDAQKWWAEAGEKYGGALTSDRQRRLFEQAIQRRSLSSVADFTTWEVEQKDKAFVGSVTAAKAASIDQAAATMRPEDVALAASDIQAKNAAFGATRGWTPEQLAEENSKDLTKLHTQVIQSLTVRSPTEAQAYYEANKGQIAGSSRAEIETKLKSVVASARGDDVAQRIWDSMGPKNDISPVELDKMEAKVREELKGDQDSVKAAIQGLKERALSHNSSQAERTAENVNSVMAVYTQTKSLSAMQRTPAWSALPALQQAQIQERVIAWQTAELNRANAADERQARREVREQSALARAGFSKYLELSTPSVLNSMSETQVQALLPTLGNELTGKLMEKKRSMTNALDKSAAQMDEDDFKHNATALGFKAYGKKSDTEQEQLGELKYRVEQMIDDAQRRKGQPLTRDEKNQLMRTEMARQVTVDGFWSNSSKAVIQLTPKEVQKVIVPQAERSQILAAMQGRYQATGRTEFEPTEDNIRRWYLRGQSRAADMIPQDAKR